MEFGSQIKKAREARQMTQEQLGAVLGVTGVTIMRYEKNQRQPKLEMLTRIANVLDIPVQDLLPEDKPDPFGWSTNEKAIDMQEAEREERLLMAFYGLTYEGQNKAITYTEDLNRIPAYKRTAHTQTEETPNTNNLPQEKEKPSEGQ